jgi:putative flippase GtrA
MNAPVEGRTSAVQRLWARVSRHQVVRYLLFGCTLFVLDLAVFLGLTFLSVPIPAAQVISRTTGAAAGFVGHKVFTFRDRDGSTPTIAVQSAGYVACTLINIVLSPIVVTAFAYQLPYNLLIVKILAEIVMVSETYLVLKWVFKKRTKA